MIVSCPNCAARFVVPKEAVGPDGRVLRCGACRHTWHFTPAAEPPPETVAAAPEPLREPPVEPPPEPPSEPHPEPPKAAPFVPMAARAWIDAPASYVAPSEPPPKAEMPRSAAETAAAAGARAAASAAAAAAEAAAERRAEAAIERRAGRGTLVAVLIFVVLVAAGAFGFYRFRHDVVALWPSAAKIYEALGIEMATPAGLGLKVPPESIKSRRESESGVPLLIVTGVVLNDGERPQRALPMQLMLLDKERKVLRTELVKIEDRTLAPGDRLEFSARIVNPPAEAAAVQIRFIESGG